MKKVILLLLLALIFLPISSQDIKVRRQKKVDIEQKAFFPDFGNNSKEILYVGENSKGLYLYKVRGKKSLTILNEDSGVKSFSIGIDNKINYSVRKMSGRKTEIVQHTYNLESGEQKELKSFALDKKTVSVDGKSIVLNNGDEDIIKLSPFDDIYYVWASLSPDGSKILFTAVGKGTFVSDLKGKILAEIGTLNSPSWINNQWVLGMDDKDDGHVTTSSDLFAVHITTGKKIELSAKTDDIALYPKSSPGADKIVFHNLKGELFTLKIRVRN